MIARFTFRRDIARERDRERQRVALDTLFEL